MAPIAPAPIELSDTRTPQHQAAQHSQQRFAVVRDPALQPDADLVPDLPEGHGDRSQQQRNPEREGECAGPALGQAGEVHQGNGRQRGRNAARQQQPRDAPVHMTGAVVRCRADHLGDGGKPQVGADGNRRVQLEDRQQQRGHQRPAAHAGHADDGAHAEPAHHRNQIHEFPAENRIPSGHALTCKRQL